MQVEFIEGPLLVRTYRAEDANALYEAARESIAEVSVWLPWCHENYSIEESREFVSSRAQAAEGDEWYSFAIFEKDSGRFLGGVGLNFFNRVHQMTNLGYWVRTSATGRGVATKAGRKRTASRSKSSSARICASGLRACRAMGWHLRPYRER